MAKKDTHLTQSGAEVQRILNQAQRVYIGLPNEIVQPDEGDICIVPAHDNVEAEAFEYRNGAWVSRADIDRALARANTAYQKPANGIPDSDIADGVIPDVSQFITKMVDDLVNYYTKSQTYTKEEVQQIVSSLSTGAFIPVAELPTASADTFGLKIYLVPSAEPQAQNIKDEFITVRSGSEGAYTYSWEQIGSTAIDLSDYVTEDALETALAGLNDVKFTAQTLTEAQKAQARTNIGATAPEVFWATYGTTTAAEIEAAIEAGKFPFLITTTSVIPYSNTTTNYIYFSGIINGNVLVYSIKRSDNSWAKQYDFAPERESRKAQTITGNESDTSKYPSTKAVYDELVKKYTFPNGGIPAADIADGVIPDVSGFITKSVNDLVNYYLKDETYTKAEVAALIGAIQQFHYEIYASRSEVETPASNVLYLIGPTGGGSDRYEEYVYDPTKQEPWVKIGDTTIVGIESITTEGDGTLTFTLTNGDSVTVDLNHTHPGLLPQVSATDNGKVLTVLSGFWAAVDIAYQTTRNLVTTISAQSTDSEYPSAKCMYDLIGDIETLINAL